MKSISFALIAWCMLILLAPGRKADAHPYGTYGSNVAPRVNSRAYAAPLPYRVYRPVYRPYAHGGRQGGSYVWGFPYLGLD
jgi:hypothetical protein